MCHISHASQVLLASIHAICVHPDFALLVGNSAVRRALEMQLIRLLRRGPRCLDEVDSRERLLLPLVELEMGVP